MIHSDPVAMGALYSCSVVDLTNAYGHGAISRLVSCRQALSISSYRYWCCARIGPRIDTYDWRAGFRVWCLVSLSSSNRRLLSSWPLLRRDAQSVVVHLAMDQFVFRDIVGRSLLPSVLLAPVHETRFVVVSGGRRHRWRLLCRPPIRFSSQSRDARATDKGDSTETSSAWPRPPVRRSPEMLHSPGQHVRLCTAGTVTSTTWSGTLQGCRFAIAKEVS